MDETKGRSKAMAGQISPQHVERLHTMVERLHLLPGTEASLNNIEVFFYELLTIMRSYPAPDGSNHYIADLEKIRAKEYEKCRDRFVSINSRNKAVHLLKNK